MPVEIPLECGRVALVSPQDAELVLATRWRSWLSFGVRYAVFPNGSIPLRMHRVILGVSAEQIVDHRDGDGLNNTRENLRIATHAENAGNRRRSPNSRSPFKGVVLLSSGRAVAQIACKRIGNFPTPEDAARAYDAAARERWGAFAALNFPNPGERSALTGEVHP